MRNHFLPQARASLWWRSCNSWENRAWIYHLFLLSFTLTYMTPFYLNLPCLDLIVILSHYFHPLTHSAWWNQSDPKVGLAKKKFISKQLMFKLIPRPSQTEWNPIWSLNHQLELILPLIYKLSNWCQKVLWLALKTDQITWPSPEIWPTDSLYHILSPCRISSHDEFGVKRYWPPKLTSQNYLQVNMLENNKLGSDLALKTE